MESTTALLIVIGIFAVIILILGVSVVILNSRVNDLQKPKYGFLGKTLSVVALVAVLGSFGGAFFLNNNADNNVDDVSVSSNEELTVLINEQEIDTSLRQYKFIAVPEVNNVEWGGNSSNRFEVFWTVSNLSGGLKSFSEIISENEPGGFLVTLERGESIVKASVRFEGSQSVNQLRVDI